MDYLRHLRLLPLFVTLLALPGARCQCDIRKAEVCVTEMEDVITRVLESTAGVTRTERLQQLCLDVIKGNNLTQCFIEATTSCADTKELGPTDVIKRWERVMQDLYGLCDGACPNFLERTVNITQCTGIIRFDALYESSYQVFCSSLNESLKCVHDTSETCPQFGNLFYDLLPQGMDQTASAICTGGCDNFDQALELLETCKKHVMDLPDDLSQACASYEKFKTCIKLSEAPVTCPMFGSLLEVLYPQHIFGLYETNCNRSQLAEGDVDKCGDVGVARIDHCLRIFALAWPSRGEGQLPTEQQCNDFMTGTQCLEKAGYAECPNLRRHFRSKTEGRHKQKIMMEQRCSKLVQGSSGRRLTTEYLIVSVVFMISLLYPKSSSLL